MTDWTCSACIGGIDHDHGPRPRLYTFGLEYQYRCGPDDIDSMIEEIDVVASSESSARAAVEATAAADYRPGWTRIIPLDVGGSAGVVQVFRGDPWYGSDGKSPAPWWGAP